MNQPVLETALRTVIDALIVNNAIKTDIPASKHATIAAILNTSYQQIYDVINDHSIINTAPFKTANGELYAQLKLYTNGKYQCYIVFKQGDTTTTHLIEHDTFTALQLANGVLKKITHLPIISDILKLPYAMDTDTDDDKHTASDDQEFNDAEEENDENEDEEDEEEYRRPPSPKYAPPPPRVSAREPVKRVSDREPIKRVSEREPIKRVSERK